MKSLFTPLLRVIYISLLIVGFSNQVFATHNVGVDMTYTCIDSAARTYEFTLVFYRDCSPGTAAPGTSQSVEFTSSNGCGLSGGNFVTMNLASSSNVSQVCGNVTDPCANPNVQGTEQYIYTGTVQLPPNCGTWTATYGTCCRSSAITNLSNSGSQGTFVQTFINPDPGGDCNSSVQFSNIPLITVCAGDTAYFNHGAYDPDGDTLVFSLVNPLDDAGATGTPIPYTGTFSATNPLSNTYFEFDSLTGQITFAPTAGASQIAIISVKVEEIRNGQVISSTVRELQVVVLNNCTNQSPVVDSNSIGGNAIAISGNTFQMCRGSVGDFSILISDPDVGDVLTMTSNIVTAIPNAVVSYIVTGTNPLRVDFVVDATTLAPGIYPFSINVSDGACPVPSVQYLGYSLVVYGAAFTNSVYCQNEQDPIPIIIGDSSGVFREVVGNPIGLVMDSITGVIDLDASNLGTYTMVYVPDTSTSRCPTDTITVTIVDIPDPTFSYPDALYCKGNPNPLPVITGTPGGVFSSNTANFLNPFTGEINFLTTPVGTHDIYYNISGGTCRAADTMSITITQQQSFVATADKYFICPNEIDNIQLLATANYTGTTPPTASYSWTPTAPLNNPIIANPVATQLTPDTFVVVYDDGVCPVATDTVKIAAPYPAEILPTSDVVICSGGSEQIGAAVVVGGGATSFSHTGPTSIPIMTTTDVPINVVGVAPAMINPSLLASMEICFNINQNRVFDLNIYLIAPSGQQVPISIGNGGFLTTSLNNVCFNITAADIITNYNGATAVPPNSSMQPQGGGSGFNGLIGGTTNGNWIIRFQHTKAASLGGNVGTINNVTINFKDLSTAAFTWSPNYNITCVACDSPIVSPTVDTCYTVVAENVFGCKDTSSVCVRLDNQLPKPTLSCGPNSTSSVTFNWVPVFGASGYTATVDGGAPFTIPIGTTSHVVPGLAVGQCVEFIINAQSSNSCLDGEPDTLTCCAQVCGQMDNINITPNGPITFCDGESVALTAPNSTTYIWSTAETTRTITATTGGIYRVTIADVNGCQDTGKIVITILPDPTPTITASGSTTICAGSSVNLDAGVGYSSYVWSTAETTQTISANATGTYIVTVSNTSGCENTDQITVTVGTAVSATVSSTPISCGGVVPSDGSATVIPSGGFGGYTYQWTSNQTTQTSTGLSANTYIVIVEDVQGCKVVEAVTVTEPSAITVTVDSTEVTCSGGSDGTATVNASGGSTVFTYLWDDPLAQTTATATGLMAGTHCVTVTDNTGCSRAICETVTEAPSGVTVSIAVDNNASCGGFCDGQATATAGGGTVAGAHNYIWSNSQTTNVATGLCAGVYSVTASDDNGCIANASITITEANSMTILLDSTEVTCNGGDDGTAILSVSGGTVTTGYTYIWDASANGQTTATATGLVAGTYCVTVADNNGCSSVVCPTVTEPSLVTVSIAGTDISCNNGNSGQAIATTGGGVVTTGYTFLWDDAATQTTATATGLVDNIYSITVTDNNGCTATSSVTISEPSAITVTADSTTVSCKGGADGTATVTTSGGTAGAGTYTYLWDAAAASQATATATGLAAGNYCVTVTDDNGCTATICETVTEPALAVSAGAVVDNNVSCNGVCDGAATVTGAGGTIVTDYIYIWTTGQTTANATGLCAGVHTVTVSDDNSCTTTASITITEPNALAIVSLDSTDISCNGGSDGTATVVVTGGTALVAYSYLWSDGAAQTTATATGLSVGNYCVTITDDNNCTIIDCIDVVEPTLVGATATVTSDYSGQDISCNGSCDGEGTVVGSGGVATTGYSYLWSDAGTQTTAIATGLCEGAYNVTVTDNNGCTATSSITVTEPSAITVTADSTTVSCKGGADGTATVTTSGGTAGAGTYTYLWDAAAASQATATATGLAAGNYCVTVTDDNGCTATICETVTEPALAVSAGAVVDNNVSCNGVCDGAATVTGAGGTIVTDYIYIWTTGQTTANATGLCAGVHTVTVSDDNSCTTTASITITEPNALAIVSLDSTDISCNGGSDGTATVVVTGGTALVAYSYLWSDGAAQTTATATGLSVGNYCVTITDDNSCTIIDCIDVVEPTLVGATATVTSDYSGQDISCNGSCDGIGTVVGSGGVATTGYSYLWSDAGTQTTAIATGLCEGAYNVTVTDNNGCTATSSITVTEPSAITVTADSTTVSCKGGADGTATVLVTGGTPTAVAGIYAYLWDAAAGNQTTATATGLMAGNYCVVVADANACTATICETVTEPALAVSAGAVVDNNVSCNGVCDGAATVTGAGGIIVTDYTYIWTAGQTTANATGLCAGVHTVTVSDDNSCTTTASITITEPNALAIVSLDSTDISCNGGSDGTATVVVTGGTALVAYSYLWSDGAAQTTATATGLSVGNYCVTITDDNNCTIIDCIDVVEPTLVGAVATVTSDYNGADVSCNGSCDGDATAVGSGGVVAGAYNYLWDATASNQATAIATGLCVGTYSVTITDDNGCSAATTVTLTEPVTLVATATGIDVSCNGGNDGQATTNGVDGTGAYTYAWDDAASQTTQTATGLIAGTYIATITDVNGCSDTALIVIAEPATAVSTTTSSTDALCFGSSDGTATVVGAGGAGGYTYLWDAAAASQTTATATGLLAGTYCVTVTDMNGCSDNTCVAVIDGNPITFSTSQTAVSCNGGADATGTINVSGGVGGFVYTWSPSGATSATATGLAAGNNCVTATDLNGCSVDTCIMILEPAALGNVTFLATHVSCNGGADGTLTVSLTGGTQPYTYLWSNGDVGNRADNLAAGNHTVTVTDANGCTLVDNATITEPTALALSFDTDSVRCKNGSDGIATAIVTGGTFPYFYLWDNGQNTASNNNLSIGTYYVTVTDIKGCVITGNVTIHEPLTAVSANINNFNNITCNGGNNGDARVDALGGTPNYTFAWSDGQMTETATGLTAGSYSVTVTDSRGCEAGANVILTEPTALVIDAHVYSNYNGADISCPGAGDGSAEVLITGGSNTGYTYAWSNGGNSAIINNLFAGTYTVTITDLNGCSIVDNVTLVDPTPLDATATHVDIFCYGDNDGQIIASAVSGTGTVGVGGYEYKLNGPGQNGNVFSNVNSWYNLLPGNYVVTVRDGNNCEKQILVTIDEPTALSTTTSNTAVSCNSGSDGTATVTVAGGTMPYNYNWNNGQTASTATGLSAGGYAVTVLDANGCDIVASVIITEPTALTGTISTTMTSCNGSTDGTATVTATGGITPYRYAWNNGQTGSAASGFAVGNHTMTITDANSCTKVLSFSISQPAILTVTTTSTAASCNATGSGTATANAAGGTGPYNYLWNDGSGQTTQTATGLIAGTYTVIITDQNGCTKSTNATVTEPSLLGLALVTSTDVTCNGGNDGTAIVGATGGSPSYSYLWSNGQVGTTATGLAAGINYTVTVTDQGGCTAVATVNVTSPNALSITSINTTAVSCYGGNNGTAGIVVAGGTPTYSISWSNSTAGNSTGNLSAGLYQVTATDAAGCSVSSDFTVTQPISPLLVSIEITDALCNGAETGEVAAIVSGGTTINGDYTYLWNTGAQTAVVDSIGAGSYTVTVTDSLGCVATATNIVGQSSNLTVAITTSTDVTCNGGANGTATALGTGGTAPLTYIWSDAQGQTTEMATGLTAGTYYVQVVDFNKCIATDSVIITEGAAISLTTVVTDASCFGNLNGSINIASSNKVITTYEWSTGAVNLNPYTGLAAGNYTVTVTTTSNCTAEFSYTVEEPDSLTADIELLTPLRCNGSNNAVLKVNTTGGKPNFSYNWNGAGPTNKKVMNQAIAGAYTVVVTDKNGCTATANYTLVSPSALTVESTGTGVKCADNADGRLVVTGKGGSLLSGNYEYSIDSITWQTGNIFADLKSGIYQVYVRDDNSCTASKPSTVESADPFFLSSFTRDTTIEYLDSLHLTAVLSDMEQTSYQWQDDFGKVIADSVLTYSIAPTEAGIYRFHAENKNGCMIDSLVKVEVTKPRRANAPLAFTPNGDGNNDNFFIQGGSKVRSINTLRVYDRWGTLVYEGTGLNVNDDNTGWDGNFKGKPANSGVYAWYAEVEFADGHVEVLKGDITLLR